jgi:hypothetical protein
VGAPLYHMYSFSLCNSCIWHGICNMMYGHLCILGCMLLYHMHFVGKAALIYIVRHDVLYMIL